MKLRRVIGEKGEALTKQCGNKAKLAVVNPGVFQFRKNKKQNPKCTAIETRDTKRGNKNRKKNGFVFISYTIISK